MSGPIRYRGRFARLAAWAELPGSAREFSSPEREAGRWVISPFDGHPVPLPQGAP